MSLISSLAAGLGLLLSAEALILLGNGVGRAGWYFLFALMGATGIHLLGACRLYGRFSGPGDEIDLLRKALGPTVALVAPLSARVTVTVVGTTALMAISGFVFNEVFFRAFPNFLFAFLFLAVIMAVNLGGPRLWKGFQMSAMIAVVIGLGVLIVAGLFWSPPPVPVLPQPSQAGAWLAALLPAALLSVGYELGFLATGRAPTQSRRGPVAAVVAGSLLLLLWGLVCLRWVPQSILADTTIPHMVTARTILGQEGRIIMGVVILAGIGAGVNALWGGTAAMLGAMGSAGLLPAAMTTSRFKGRLPVLCLTAATAGMLAFGVAGSDHLVIFLRTSLTLWLLHYAVLHWAAFLTDRREPGPSARGVTHILIGLVLGLIGAGLLASGHERTIALTFITMVIGSVLALGQLFTRLPPGADNHHQNSPKRGRIML